MKHIRSHTFGFIAERRLLGFSPPVRPPAAPANDPEKQKATQLANTIENQIQNNMGKVEAKNAVVAVVATLKERARGTQNDAFKKTEAALDGAAKLEFEHEKSEAKKTIPAGADQEVKAAQAAMAKINADFAGLVTVEVDAAGNLTKVNVLINGPQAGPNVQRQAPKNRGEELTQTMEDAQREFEAAGNAKPPDTIKQFAAAMKGLGAAFQFMKGSFDGGNDKPPTGTNAGPNGGPNSGTNSGTNQSANRNEVAQMIKEEQKKDPAITNATKLLKQKEDRLIVVKGQLDPTKPGPAKDSAVLNGKKVLLTAQRDALNSTDPQRGALDAQITAIDNQIKAIEPALEALRKEQKQLDADIAKIKNAKTESVEEQKKMKGTVDTIKALAADATTAGRLNGPELKKVADAISVVAGTDGVSLELKFTAAPADLATIRVTLQKFGMDATAIDGAGKVSDPKPVLDSIQKLVERVQNPEREITEVRGLKIDKVANKIKGLGTISNADLGPAYVDIMKSTSIVDSLKDQVVTEVEKRFAGGVVADNAELLAHLLVHTSTYNEGDAKQIAKVLAADGLKNVVTIDVNRRHVHFDSPKKDVIKKFLKDNKDKMIAEYGNAAEIFLKDLAR